MKITKGYKAFNADMTCRGKQYAENTTFIEDGTKIWEKGMHFCVNPLDCLDYYPLIDNEGNKVLIAEVEGENAITDDGKNYVTKTLHIRNIVSIEDATRKYADSVDSDKKKNTSIGGEDAQLIGGEDAQLIGGDFAQLIGGDNATAIGGNCATAIGGDYATAIGGNYAKSIGGYSAKSIGGNYAKAIVGLSARSIGGENSAVICGHHSFVKLGIHSIALGCIFKDGIQQPPVPLYIDGVTYKADTEYFFDGEKWEEANA